MKSRADRSRALAVRRIQTVSDAADEVAELAARGGAVAWIRNAVDDAIEAVAELKARGLSPVLLHARFAMGDRLGIEERVTATLGRKDTTGERRGFVLVGTQILEQSLDYDVDAMITDLAPIDLMIQRAGRLWRHARPHDRPIEREELIVLSPDPEDVGDKDWYRAMSPRAAAVYGHHGIVWRSAKQVFDAGAIRTPDGVRELIEGVYGSDGLDDIPESLRRASQDAIGSFGAARSFANANLLALEKGYGGCSELWTPDKITPTRLGEPVTVFRLGRIEDGRVLPWYPDALSSRAWALSEVSLSRKKADGVPDPERDRAQQINAAKEFWPKWERDLPLLVLECDGDLWRGRVTSGSGEQQAIYDQTIGLRLALC